MTPDQWANHVFEKSREIEPKEQPVKKSVSCNSNSMIDHMDTHIHTCACTFVIAFLMFPGLSRNLQKGPWYPLLSHAFNFLSRS